MLVASLLAVLAAAPRLAAPDAEGGTRPVRVEISAPEGCSDADAFFVALRSRTGRVRRAVGDEPRTTLHVRLTRARNGVTGDLRVVDHRGETDTRKVQGAGCDDVVQALSLTAALAIDPAALLDMPAVPPASAASSDRTRKVDATDAATTGPSAATAAGTADGNEPASQARRSTFASTSEGATATPAAHPSIEVEDRRDSGAAARATGDRIAEAPALRPRASVEFGAGALAAIILEDGLSAGLTMTARKTAAVGPLRPSFGVAIVYLRNDVLQDPSPVAVALLGAAGAVCPVGWTAGIVTFEPCAMAVVGWLSAHGRGLTHTSTVDHLWLSTGMAARARATMGPRVSIELEAGASIPFFQRSFFATVPDNVVAKTPQVFPMGGISVVIALDGS